MKFRKKLSIVGIFTQVVRHIHVSLLDTSCAHFWVTYLNVNLATSPLLHNIVNLSRHLGTLVPCNITTLLPRKILAVHHLDISTVVSGHINTDIGRNINALLLDPSCAHR